ncbi:DNA-binding transcriptional regulator, MarR family [Cohaesibacter sp. ES.047]|uniref:MarR family winged helix-turn-helix transcriptional regulator n=1 Tax=Cohaesibacter sp. ES.047 TaxID=1798205 RepID=UPI000BB74426|nr:MarR family transcriptional regulator [Cohaesibacter sp. ES.047]SNY90721.1 DNA-binding transcriptional regulator, MarR family [Cohaesibacter sp. ES.047]
MTEKPSEIQIGYLIFEVSKLIRRQFEEEAKSLGLTLQQSRVMGFLQRHPAGQSQSSIAREIDSDPMTLSGILDRLEKRDLVERSPDPQDSRAKLVTLTSEGVSLFVKARALADGIGKRLHDRALCRLDEDQLDALLLGLTSIRDELSTTSPDQRDQVK